MTVTLITVKGHTSLMVSKGLCAPCLQTPGSAPARLDPRAPYHRETSPARMVYYSGKNICQTAPSYIEPNDTGAAVLST